MTHGTQSTVEAADLLSLVMELYDISREEAEKLVTYSNFLQNKLAIILGAALQKPYYQQKAGFATTAVNMVGGMLSAAPFSPLITTPLTMLAKTVAGKYEEKTLLSLLKFVKSIGVHNLAIFTKELNRRYVETRIDRIVAEENVEFLLEDYFDDLIKAIIKIDRNTDAAPDFNPAALSILPSPLVRESKPQIFDDLIERILKEAIKDYSQQNSPAKKLLTERKSALIRAQEELQKAVHESPFRSTLSSEERDKFVQASPIRLRMKIFEQTTPKQVARDEILRLTAKINRSLAKSIEESSDEDIVDHNQDVSQKILHDIEEIEGIALKNGYEDICRKIGELKFALNHALEIDVKRREFFSETSERRLQREESLSDFRRILFPVTEEEVTEESESDISEDDAKSDIEEESVNFLFHDMQNPDDFYAFLDEEEIFSDPTNDWLEVGVEPEDEGIVISPSPSLKPNIPETKIPKEEVKLTEKDADKKWWRLQIRPIITADKSDVKYQLALSLTISMKTLFDKLPDDLYDTSGLGSNLRSKMKSSMPQCIIFDETRLSFLREKSKKLELSGDEKYLTKSSDKEPQTLEEISDRMMYLLSFGTKEKEAEECKELEKRFLKIVAEKCGETPPNIAKTKDARPLSFAQDSTLTKKHSASHYSLN